MAKNNEKPKKLSLAEQLAMRQKNKEKSLEALGIKKTIKLDETGQPIPDFSVVDTVSNVNNVSDKPSADINVNNDNKDNGNANVSKVSNVNATTSVGKDNNDNKEKSVNNDNNVGNHKNVSTDNKVNKQEKDNNANNALINENVNEVNSDNNDNNGSIVNSEPEELFDIEKALDISVGEIPEFRSGVLNKLLQQKEDRTNSNVQGFLPLGLSARLGIIQQKLKTIAKLRGIKTRVSMTTVLIFIFTVALKRAEKVLDRELEKAAGELK